MRTVPSLFRIIRTDYAASLGALFPLAVWGLALGVQFFDPEAATFFRMVAPVVTLAGLALLFWRIRMIVEVFGEGDETPGVIVDASFLRGRGRVDYIYTYQSQKYQSGNAVQATSAARAMGEGRAVTVLLHRLKPKRAFVRELYF